jgi:predicted Zn-dependent peptidase
VSRPLEQANIVLGVNGLVRTDPRRYALGVLNAALGGGTSSRLFQEVRERRGLAYSVYSYAAHYADAGTFGVAVGCLPSKVPDVLEVVRGELTRIAADGITLEELQRGQGQLRGSLVLSLEDSGSRMSRIAKAELLYDELPSIDDVLDRVAAVTLEDVNDLARRLFTQRQTLAVVGPFESLPG